MISSFGSQHVNSNAAFKKLLSGTKGICPYRSFQGVEDVTQLISLDSFLQNQQLNTNSQIILSCTFHLGHNYSVLHWELRASMFPENKQFLDNSVL